MVGGRWCGSIRGGVPGRACAVCLSSRSCRRCSGVRCAARGGGGGIGWIGADQRGRTDARQGLTGARQGQTDTRQEQIDRATVYICPMHPEVACVRAGRLSRMRYGAAAGCGDGWCAAGQCRGAGDAAAVATGDAVRCAVGAVRDVGACRAAQSAHQRAVVAHAGAGRVGAGDADLFGQRLDFLSPCVEFGGAAAVEYVHADRAGGGDCLFVQCGGDAVAGIVGGWCGRGRRGCGRRGAGRRGRRSGRKRRAGDLF